MVLSIAKRLGLGVLSLFPTLVNAQDLSLDIPIDCELGETCFVQQYVDHDPSDGVQDFTCGLATYDGHRGTDFRIRNFAEMRAGVDILASAGGRINGVRDGMEDRLVKTKEDRAAIKGRDCGNGVLVQHGNGWVTQYCHMKQGSVVHKQGDLVKAGDKLGEVGLSGNTQFPHVHISVRKDDNVIDPFNPEFEQNTCRQVIETTLWSKESGLNGPIQPTQIFDIGFGDGPTDLNKLREGAFDGFKLVKGSKALVGYARVMNLEEGDRVQATLSGPKGVIAEKTQQPFDRRKAQTMMFIGKKAPRSGWAKGTYRFAVSVLRKGAIIEREVIEITRD